MIAQESTPQRPGNLAAEQRQQTTTTRPSNLQQNHSHAPSIARFDTARLQSRPQNERSNTAGTGMSRLGTIRNTASRATRENITQEPPRRPEKKQEQTVDIENDYFTLNPWYNEQKAKPVFGLGAPLPRTVRRGMWWGRGDLRDTLYKVDEDTDGIARQDGLKFDDNRVPEEDSEDSETTLGDGRQQNRHDDPERFQTTINGRNVNVRRVPTSEANEVLRHRDLQTHSHDNHRAQEHHEGQERAPIDEHGLGYSDARGQQQHFGLQDGLPPLQELDTHATSRTKQEQKEEQRKVEEAEREFYNQYRNPIARLRAKYPQAPAEFLATFIYLLIGLCVNLSVATSKNKTGSFETQAWGWGFAMMIGIYLGGGISGSHLSPTISIALSIYRGFPWRMAFVYICMQLLAGLCAGGIAYALYADAIRAVDPGLTLDMTGKALFPQGPIYSIATGFFNDFVYMAIFVCVVFALGDDQNSPPGQGMTAFVVGLTGMVTMIGLGYNTGLGISPARDLGPRLIAFWVGYEDAFSNAYWAYGSWGASISGALCGGLLYDLCIFVGGESPINYRWPQPGDIKWRAIDKKNRAKDKIQRVA
ncbi:glycerol uptake facilitator [Pyrenophora seminiperda CCB06]|uniref:Glycerol uptake facilitator n=1 Tax=Pyrenophora seminiperda CCB06 TaxID=1302712 RepID=A0A3M7M424_9PLEO|nr:glycerol uptake facilitator [Pyrenophora seminiperda CCB06]